MPVSYLTRSEVLGLPLPWQEVVDPSASGGSYFSTTKSGATLHIDIPTGATAVMLLATARADSGVCTYTVDGGPALPWDQFNGATASADPAYYWYRTTSPPIFVEPATAHTIILTAAAGGKVTTLDAVEVWQAQPYAPNTATWFGHSIVYGFDRDAPPTPIASRFSTLVSGQFALTEINQAVPGEDLTNGIFGYYVNDYAPMPGWQRAEAGADFAGTTWGRGSYNLGGALPQPTWWATCPQLAVVMHARNDVFLGSVYDGAPSLSNRPNPNTLAGDTPRTTAPPAGAGYALKRYTQRLRELVWRMNCASPQTLIVLCGICYDTTLAANYANERQNYDDAIAAVAHEPNVSNAIFVGTWAQTLARGGAALLQWDGAHPNAAGHQVLAEIVRSGLDVPASVTALSDHGGPTIGRNIVTITGVGFFAGATVTFGGVSAMSVRFVDSTTLLATAPSHGSGTVDVAVTNPYQSPATPSGTLHDAYTYVSAVPTSRIPTATASGTPTGTAPPSPPTRTDVSPTPGAPTPAPLPPRR